MHTLVAFNYFCQLHNSESILCSLSLSPSLNTTILILSSSSMVAREIALDVGSALSSICQSLPSKPAATTPPAPLQRNSGLTRMKSGSVGLCARTSPGVRSEWRVLSSAGSCGAEQCQRPCCPFCGCRHIDMPSHASIVHEKTHPHDSKRGCRQNRAKQTDHDLRTRPSRMHLSQLITYYAIFNLCYVRSGPSSCATDAKRIRGAVNTEQLDINHLNTGVNLKPHYAGAVVYSPCA
eukprot:COSAG06_NODE_11576_length_1489_cov_5.664987_1_plen_235_part_10